MILFTMLIGIPGAGKSSYAKKYKNNNTIICSSDSIREELYGSATIQGNSKEVFSIMKNRAVEALNNNKNVIYDATNLTAKTRISTINYIKNNTNNVVFSAVVIATSVEIAIKNDLYRSRTVGKDVILKMLKTFVPPTESEGFSSIRIITNKDNLSLNRVMKSNNISHDNPNHKKNVFLHMCAAEAYINKNKGISKQLLKATLYHDIGKYVTKEFDEKGIAHYLQHANVGAYIYLASAAGATEEKLYIANLIAHHMDLFNPSINVDKYKRKFGTTFYNDLMLLHKADINADLN